MKKAIVTGGSGLIGTSLCEMLIKEGYDVASFDIKPGDSAARWMECDVANEANVLQAFKALGWDRLDLLINNAGIASPDLGPVENLSLQDWRGFTDSHLTSAFLMTRSAIPLLRQAPKSSILNIISTRAFMSEPNTEAYAASKGGLFGLTHALAMSLGPNVRVNAIAPGWISDGNGLSKKDHEQHPVGRVGTPEDIAHAVLYLVGADFMTGQILTLDGGMMRKMIYAE